MPACPACPELRREPRQGAQLTNRPCPSAPPFRPLTFDSSTSPSSLAEHCFSLPAVAGLPAAAEPAALSLGGHGFSRAVKHLKSTKHLSPSHPTAFFAVACEDSLFPSPTISSSREATCFFDVVPSLTPLESALTDELRVLPEISGNCLWLSPLESALTDTLR